VVSPSPRYTDPAVRPGVAGQDPFLGQRPVTLTPRPDDGLWLAGQLCDWVDLRSGPDGLTIRLQVPGQGNEETAGQPVRSQR
jgi:hypothetical protein